MPLLFGSALLQDFKLEGLALTLLQNGCDNIADWQDISDADLKHMGFGVGHIIKWKKMMATYTSTPQKKLFESQLSAILFTGIFSEELSHLGLQLSTPQICYAYQCLPKEA